MPDAPARTRLQGSKSHTLILLPGTVLPGGAAFLGMVWISRTAGLETVGLVSLARVAAAFGAAMLANGPAIAAMHSLARGDDSRLAAFRGAMVTRMAAVVPVVFVVGVATYVVAPDLGRPLIWGVPLLVVETMFAFECDAFRYQHRFVRSSALSSLRPMIGWVAAGAAASFGLGFEGVVGAYLVVGGLITTAFRLPKIARVDDVTREELHRTWGSIAALNIAGYALNNGDQYVIGAISGPAAVGVYSLGYQLGGGLAGVIGQPIGGALNPRVVREWHTERQGPVVARATARRAATLVLVGGALVVGVVWSAGALRILDHLTTAADFPFVAATIALAASVNAAGSVAYSSQLLAGGHTRDLSGCAWATLAASAVLVPALTATYGIRGAAVATLLAYVLLALLLQWRARARWPDEVGQDIGLERPRSDGEST